MSGLLRCGRCQHKLYDPRPRNLSGAEKAKRAAYERREDDAPYTHDEIDSLLDRINRDRPSGRAWPVEAAQAHGLPRSMHGVWTLRGDEAVLMLRCPGVRRVNGKDVECPARYAITDDDMHHRVYEAIRRDRDVILTGRDR